MSICEICGRLFYAKSFCEFREFRGRTLRSQTICVHPCHLWENYQVGGVGMAGCHTLLSVFCGQYTHPKLLWVPCIPWENTHPLGEKRKEGMAECHALL